MKRAIVFIHLILASFVLHAQSYVRLTKDTALQNVKLYKDEIFEVSGEEDTARGRVVIIFGDGHLQLEKGYYKKADVDNEFGALKDSLVRKKENGSYLVHVDRIPGKGVITLVHGDDNRRDLKRKEPIEIAADKMGSTFRLLIPGSPSIVYNADNIPPPKGDNAGTAGGDTTTTGDTKTTTTGQASFLEKNKVYILIGTLVLIGVVVFLLRKKKKKNSYEMQVRTAVYMGNGLFGFANQHGTTIEQLIKWNPNFIPAGYKKLDEKEKKKEEAKMKGKEFIVGYQKVERMSTSMSNEGSTSYGNETEQTPSAIDGTGNDSAGIKEAIRNMEANLARRIDMLGAGKAAAEERDKLVAERDGYLQQAKKLETRVKQLEDENGQLNTSLLSSKETGNQAESEARKYRDKLLFAGFLDNYARVAADYFAFLASVSAKAHEFYNRMIAHGEKEVSVLSLLLAKCHIAIPAKTGNWEEIILGIKNSGTISNQDVIRSFGQLPNDNEKVRTFQRLLFTDVLEKYTAALLLLSEELRNFSKFTGQNTGIIKDIELSFSPLTREIVNKAKSVGLDANYAPLFENYESYASVTRAVSEKRSLPYSSIGVERDAIAEVISYGFDAEKTRIILA